MVNKIGKNLSKNWYVLVKSIYTGKFRVLKGFDTLEDAESYINYKVNYLYALKSNYKILPKN